MLLVDDVICFMHKNEGHIIFFFHPVFPVGIMQKPITHLIKWDIKEHSNHLANTQAT